MLDLSHKLWRRVLWLAYGMLLGAVLTFVGGARAETIGATGGATGVAGAAWYVPQSDRADGLAGALVLAAPASGVISLSWCQSVVAGNVKFSDGYVPQAGDANNNWGASSCGFGRVDICTACYSVSIPTAGFCAGSNVPVAVGAICGGVYSCPVGQNWTLSGASCSRPDCVLPQSRNGSTGICEAGPCQARTAVESDRWYDVGTDAKQALKFICVGGCTALYSGMSVSKSSLVAGVRHYYMFGGYDLMGAGAVDVCTAGATNPAKPSGADTVPMAQCASNQIEGLIDGKLNCWNVPTEAGAAPTLSNPDVAPTVKATVTETVTGSGGDTVTTKTATGAAGGQSTTVVTCVGGNCSSVTTEAGKDQTEDKDKVSAGTGAGMSDLYTADISGKTFAGSIGSFKTGMAGSPAYVQATSFFNLGAMGAGECSGLSTTVNVLSYSFDLDLGGIMCGPLMVQMMSYLSMGLVLIFSVVAFSIAFL